jgi:hypothetical protein
VVQWVALMAATPQSSWASVLTTCVYVPMGGVALTARLGPATACRLAAAMESAWIQPQITASVRLDGWGPSVMYQLVLITAMATDSVSWLPAAGSSASVRRDTLASVARRAWAPTSAQAMVSAP